MFAIHNIGLFLACFGALALFGGLWRRLSAGKTLRAPVVKSGKAAARAEGAGAVGEIAVEGPVACSRVLTSPITGTACLYYEYEVLASWNERGWDRSVNEMKTGTIERKIAGERRAARFAIDDGSGKIYVDAEDGGDIDLVETFSASKGGKSFRSFGELREGREQGYTFGRFKMTFKGVPPDALFKVRERILKPNGSLFVQGTLLEGGRIGTSAWSRLIISGRSREQYLADSLTLSRHLMIGGSLATVAGLGICNWPAGCVAALTLTCTALFKMYRKRLNVCLPVMRTPCRPAVLAHW